MIATFTTLPMDDHHLATSENSLKKLNIGVFLAWYPFTKFKKKTLKLGVFF
jgi:hypothetical protein